MSSFVPQRGWVGFIGLVVLVLAFVVAVPNVRADDNKVTVSVVAILATDQNEKVEKKLTGVAAEVQKLNPKLTGFQTAKETRKDLAIDTPHKFDLVEGQGVTITIEEAANKDNKNRLKVSPPTLGDITYCTTCGKFLPIITEYKTKDGEVLIIAIRVQPCREK
jgi:uncharacterized protein YlxW (UPF0749 family)